MRIAFLCSSLEPGKNGVGDYATLLATECARQGHPTALIALNDRHVEQVMEGTLSNGTTGASAIPYLRLPHSDDWTKRITRTVAFLQTFAPNWVSLQFVCYGFQDKGIVAKQARYLGDLRRALEPVQTHLMLHELWIGGSPSSSIKDNLVGNIQRHFVLGLIRDWKPAVVHTSNDYYRQKLAQSGLKHTNILPLFGHIPVESIVENAWFYAELEAAQIPIMPQTRAQFLLGGFLGSLHSEWKPEPLLSQLQAAAQMRERKLIILSAGRMGSAGQNVWNEMRQRYKKQAVFYDFGEKKTQQISNYLHSLDFGIAASPLHLIGKSSAAASMVDHGLPIIVTRVENGFGLKETETTHLPAMALGKTYTIHTMDAFLAELMQDTWSGPSVSRLPSITRCFLDALQAASGIDSLS